MIQRGLISWSISWPPRYGSLHRSVMACTRISKISLIARQDLMHALQPNLSPFRAVWHALFHWIHFLHAAVPIFAICVENCSGQPDRCTARQRSEHWPTLRRQTARPPIRQDQLHMADGNCCNAAYAVAAMMELQGRCACQLSRVRPSARMSGEYPADLLRVASPMTAPSY